jgi:hypothetical protein
MIRFKILTNTVYVFLAALIIYNSFGYLLLYFPTSVLIKHFVNKSIKGKKINPEDLSTLAFIISDFENNKYDFIWMKPGKEFKFNGKMYDIENKEVSGDTIYYTVYYDQKENILEEMFALHFTNSKKDNTQSPVQRVLLVGMFSEEIKLVLTILNDRITSKIPLQKNEAGLLPLIKDVLTPPPRNIV